MHTLEPEESAGFDEGLLVGDREKGEGNCTLDSGLNNSVAGGTT